MKLCLLCIDHQLLVFKHILFFLFSNGVTMIKSKQLFLKHYNHLICTIYAVYVNRVIKIYNKDTIIICNSNTVRNLYTIWFMNFHSKLKVPYIFLLVYPRNKTREDCSKLCFKSVHFLRCIFLLTLLTGN